MKYCRYLSPSGAARYAYVERQDGALWAMRPMIVPEEDLAARLASLEDHSTAAFHAAPLESLTLLPPVTPSKIVCVGRNYSEHAAELGNEIPKEPLLFLKPPSSLLAAGQPIRLPALSKRVDYDGTPSVPLGRSWSWQARTRSTRFEARRSR
jgi:2-keto-4-pentenoate hydratase/2-oxohepta-3-ene-1,7-dioic acid hydratase in catechol pathway